ncbi:MAG: hypothetical protein SFY56_05385 [Bacteroidota bacterium]|nr:hypothetical protein [Bacteroidota bacterium]
MIKKYILFLIFNLSFLISKAQFYNLPNDYSFNTLTQKQLAKKDSNTHSGIQPYIPFFSDKYLHVSDTHRIFKYIVDDPALDVVFFKHVIRVEPHNENFKLRLDPILNLEIGRDFSDTITRYLNNNTRGFIASGIIGSKFYFETMFAENQSRFPNYIANNANATTVIPGQGRWKAFKITGYDYAFSSGFFSFQPLKNLNIQAGHGKQKIGNGYRSLLLSDNAFNYPYARFTQQWFKGRVQYSNIYAMFMNLVPATKIPVKNAERLFQKKAASFQYLSINATKFLNIGFFQGMIWQAGDDKNKQNLSLEYFNPLIYTNIVPFGLNNKNNILAGVDLKFKITHKLNVYGQAMLDKIGDTTKLGNGFGYQTGVNYFDAFNIKNLFIQAEYNFVSEGSYVNPFNSTTNQSYSHYNQNLAFTPNYGKEILLMADYKWKRYFTNLKYNYQLVPLNNDYYYSTTIINGKVGYLINPSYNLNVMLGVNYRLQNFNNFKDLNNQTSYIYFGFKTNLYNVYYDF